MGDAGITALDEASVGIFVFLQVTFHQEKHIKWEITGLLNVINGEKQAAIGVYENTTTSAGEPSPHDLEWIVHCD